MANKSVKLIDSTLFDGFNTLHSDESKERIAGSLKLLEHLKKHSGDDEKKSKECEYTLKRLIRGLGASTSSSRSGFYSTFIAFLCTNDNVSIKEIFNIMQKELNSGKEITNKEDSDALVGRILLCGALIRSKKILTSESEDITECVSSLVKASKHKQFHGSLAYTYLVELLEKLSADQFNTILWPIMKKTLSCTWEKHTINTVYFLLVVQEKYPQIIDSEFLQNSIKTTEILTPLSYKHLGRLFWGNTSISAAEHPAYNVLSTFLVKCKSSQLTKFWVAEINESLAAPNKIKEVVTLKVLTNILSNKNHLIDVNVIKKLISVRFIKMIVHSLNGLKHQRHEYLSGFYGRFFDALTKYFDTIDDEDGKCEIIQKFLLHPGCLMLEKILSHKVIHQLASKLNANGISQLFDLFKNILLGRIQKNPDASGVWMNNEKQYAVSMMQYLLSLKASNSNIEWRTNQMEFLFGIFFFYSTNDGVPTKKDFDGGIITKEISLNVKNAFYSSLQTKFSNLKDEKHFLLQVATFINRILSKKSVHKYVRDTIADKTLNAWKSMYGKVTQTKINDDAGGKKRKKIDLVFHILFLQMGLQLFRESEVAQAAIVDLEQCWENAIKNKKNKNTADQPEWIEVIIDLFLHLLSQNTGFLRAAVSTVFPHLCQHLTMTAAYQIISVLDMKDGKNPLSQNGNDQNVENGDPNDDDESDENSEDSDDEDEQDEAQANDEDKLSESSDENDDENDLMEDEEGTVSDQLRSAISTALVTAGLDADNESVDLNDIDDKEVERLDNVLSAAFQINKKPNLKKKTKEERITATTLMHFRIRVLDLIEIYIKHHVNLAISLEIFIGLFNMIEFCNDKDLQPLSGKLNRVLKSLLAIRQFDCIEDCTENQLCELLKSLLEKKVNTIALGTYNKLLSNSFAFIINCSQLIRQSNETDDESAKTILGQTADYLKEFIKTRNPTISFGLLQDIFKMRWIGVWSLGKCLVKTSLKSGIRNFRKAQSMELLALMYKNHGFITADKTQFNNITKDVENHIVKYLTKLSDTENISAKQFSALIGLLLEINKCHKIPGIEPILNWTEIGHQIQTIRQRVLLISMHTYKSLCRCLGIKVLKKSTENRKINGTTTANDDDDDSKDMELDDRQDENIAMKKSTTLKRKKDTEPPENKKLKRLKKEERLRIASEGMNSISFASNINNDLKKSKK